MKVKQYGITKEGFNFLAKMKENTEQVGGIFDPQPTELKGNIFCMTNPCEKVIGFMHAGRISEKRIFIKLR
ncbi:MAG TPA: DUF4249 family protein [Pedobacter sp.]|jgi:hypothetical protein